MKPTHAPEGPPVDWQGRCNLARSILDQRPAGQHTADLARLALDGATVQDLLDMERLGA